jgi:hypothetical protein
MADEWPRSNHNNGHAIDIEVSEEDQEAVAQLVAEAMEAAKKITPEEHRRFAAGMAAAFGRRFILALVRGEDEVADTMLALMLAADAEAQK